MKMNINKILFLLAVGLMTFSVPKMTYAQGQDLSDLAKNAGTDKQKISNEDIVKKAKDMETQAKNLQPDLDRLKKEIKSKTSGVYENDVMEDLKEDAIIYLLCPICGAVALAKDGVDHLMNTTADLKKMMVENLREQKTAVLKELANTTDPKKRAALEQKIKILDETAPIVSEYVEKYMTQQRLERSAEELMKAAGGGDAYYYTDQYGNVIIIDEEGNSVSGVTKGCMALPEKLAESKTCIFCPLFKVIFDAVQVMATQSFLILGGPISKVIVVGLALFIAIKVLASISSLTKQDAPKMLTELLIQCGNVLFAYLLLVNSGFVYDKFIGPVLIAGLEFGSSLLFESGAPGGAPYMLLRCGEISVSGGGLIPTAVYDKLDCFIRNVQDELAKPQAIGSSLMCVARHAGKTSVMRWENVMWDFGMLFQGLIIWVFSLLLSIAFGFYLIDATVRLGIVGALMPMLIACWPFKPTSGYTKTGWAMILNTFFTYVFMGLVVTVNIQLIGQALGGTGSDLDGLTGFQRMEKAINGDNIEQLKEMLDIGFSGFLILIACCIFGFKLMGQATELASKMAGYDGGTNIGANIGGMAYNATRDVGKRMAFGKADEKGHRSGGVLGAAKGAMSNVGKAGDLAKRGGAMLQRAGANRNSKFLSGAGAVVNKMGGGIQNVGRVTNAVANPGKTVSKIGDKLAKKFKFGRYSGDAGS